MKSRCVVPSGGSLALKALQACYPDIGWRTFERWAKDPMNIIVFGATGATGKEAVRQLLERGDRVTAYVRNPDKLGLQHPSLRVLQGQMDEDAAVARALADQQAVLCCIGPEPSRAKHVDVCTESTKAILRAMTQSGVRRLVVQTAFGAGESRDWGLSAKSTRIVMPGIMEDKDRQEALVRNSGLAWTIVRPPTLTKGPRTGRYRVRLQARLWLWNRISRADVADFMIQQLDSDTFLRQAPCICYA